MRTYSQYNVITVISFEGEKSVFTLIKQKSFEW